MQCPGRESLPAASQMTGTAPKRPRNGCVAARFWETQTCWGDTGNGEQTGWFVWGSILARRAVKNELARVAGS